ncbi:MAG: hypothetical protein WA906_10360 [Pacificimonas sp.]
MPGLVRLFLFLIAFCANASVAQITSEAVVNNHGTTTTYSQNYTPGAGSNRVVLAIVFSEYDLDQSSTPTSVTLGGVSMTALGTIEGAGAKRNRMNAYIMPEADIPPGTSAFSVSYGPDPASSLIYLATILKIEQASLTNIPVGFSKDCFTGTSPRGRIAFAPVTASANDLVFSFVGTGDRDNQTNFQNGANEFLDESVRSPGFSLAGGVRAPSAGGSFAGNARLSDGCHRRPSTVQIVLQPELDGTDGTVNAAAAVVAGNSVTITVADSDLNIRTGGIDQVTVTVFNDRTGETETVTLVETGPNSGIFSGSLPTATSGNTANNSGTLNVAVNDRLTTRYFDSLTEDGGSATRTDITVVTATGAPASLDLAKSVVPAATSGLERFSIPGSDVLYTLTVTNTGDGAVDEAAMFVLDPLPADLTFFNGDPVAGDGDNASVLFAQSGAGLSFDASTDLRFAGAGSPPADFASCSLAVPAGYQPSVRYLCLRPRGEMLPGSPDPSFTMTFRMRIK